MRMKMSFDVRTRKNNTGAITKAMRARASAVVERTGNEAVDIERSLSRVDTGEMREGWTFKMDDDLHGTNYNDVPHAVFNEYGTRYTPAQPMIHPAFDQLRPQYQRDIGGILDV